MSEEENVRVIDEADEAFNKKDWARFENYIANAIVTYAPGLLPEPLKGRQATMEFLKAFVSALPDFHVRALRTIAQGDWVAREYHNTGTHTGPLVGPGGRTIPPTNKRVEFTEVDLFKVEGGEVTEFRLYFDQIGFLTQLGLMPQ